MYYKTITRKELELRVEYQKITYWGTGARPKSFGWLESLLSDLDKAGDFETTLSKVLRRYANRLSKTKEDADRICFELSHIPVEGKVEWKEKERFGLVFRSSGYLNQCKFDTTTFPQNALPEYCPLENLTQDSVHWFFFTLPELRKFCAVDELSTPIRIVDISRINQPTRINQKYIILWSEQDSIVHWIMQFASTKSRQDRPQITQHGHSPDDIYWKLHLPPTETVIESPPILMSESIESPPSVESPLETQTNTQIQKMKATDKILDYIQKQGEVTTTQIEAQAFCKRSNVYKTLNKLQKDGKIVKISHGRYAPVKS